MDMLEKQIGDLGGEEIQKAPIMGKLKHKASYGQKEDLSDDEQKKLEAFMKRSNAHRSPKVNMTEEEIDAPTIAGGWIPIDRTELGWRSIYYPGSWEFFVRPATVQAIKNWTAIDEERPDVVNKVFNEIIKTCVKISSKDGSTIKWDQLKSWDRFWFILKVREYTFTKGESKIEFTDACSECDEEIIFNLTSDSLFYEFPDEELVEKYWTGESWEIDPSEYGVNAQPVTLYTPTLAKDEAIIEWATAKVQNKQKIDETFIKFLTWMLNKPSRDAQMLDRQIQKLYKEYKDWDIDMFTFMNDVINNITINPSEKLKVTCPHCGQEATSTVRFPNGVKVLFEVKTNIKKFGSR